VTSFFNFIKSFTLQQRFDDLHFASAHDRYQQLIRSTPSLRSINAVGENQTALLGKIEELTLSNTDR